MKIAVAGSGISGLASAYWLSASHDVTLFETDERLGGHTKTVDVEIEGKEISVDTGFIVYNEHNYPLFTGLLSELGVATQDADMSFSVTQEHPFLEFSGTGIPGLFAQKKNFVSPSFWRLLADIVRFGRIGKKILAAPPSVQGDAMTMGQFLRDHSFSALFIDSYLVPLGSSIWSADPTTFLEFPVRALLYFFNNHGLLTYTNRPQWRTVTGGSQRYIDAITAKDRFAIHTNTPVEQVTRDDHGVDVVTSAGTARFDALVIATHSDQALSLLGDPSAQEAEVLNAIRYQPNSAVLHTDATLMPKLRAAWASWNYHVPQGPSRLPTLTYWMNNLQSLDAPRTLLVTLNRDDEIDPSKVLGTFNYHHPIYDPGTFAAQRRWAEINGTRRTWFAGAYWGYGFHEDGIASARRVVDAIDGAT